MTPILGWFLLLLAVFFLSVLFAGRIAEGIAEWRAGRDADASDDVRGIGA